MRPTVPLLILAGTMLAGCGGGKSGTIKTGNASSPPGGGEERSFRLPGASMEPTYGIGAHVRAKLGAAPTIGAVVIVHPPEGAEQEECGPTPHVVKLDGAACGESIPKEDKGTSFVERVVADPGDSISIREGHVYRRPGGSTTVEREPDPYIRGCGGSQECNFPIQVGIPAGTWFLMGDNRGESDDSRFWGPVPRAWIVGVVTGVE